MSTITDVNRQWATRPADERFLSLPAMAEHFSLIRQESRVLPARLSALSAHSTPEGIALMGASGKPALLNNWSYTQLANMIGVPPVYVSSLPTDLAVANLDHALGQYQDGEKMPKMLVRKLAGGSDNADKAQALIRAINSPAYEIFYNSDVVRALMERFGDGLNGDFRIPGEFGEDVPVTIQNTTLYASQSDMFVCLADEQHRVLVPNRRGGEAGSLARGFIVSNTEEGNGTFYVKFFYFDYMCSNRIVWGAEGVKEIRLRHTKNVNQRWIDVLAPQVIEFVNSSPVGVEQRILAAQNTKLDDPAAFFKDKLAIGPRIFGELEAIHKKEENDRPIETLWDAQVAVTARGKAEANTSDRMIWDTLGGKILDYATV